MERLSKASDKANHDLKGYPGKATDMLNNNHITVFLKAHGF